MHLPERFSNLPEYAFPRLRALLDGHAPGGDVLHMSIGEPKSGMPDWIGAVVAEAAAGFAKYPPNEGSAELLEAIAGWVSRRYGVTLDPVTEIMALNGTREGLFNAALALCPEHKAGQHPVMLIPNPFYQVYAVGAAAVGAEAVFLPATRETGFLPDLDTLDPDLLDRTAVFWICSPSNPQGAIADRDYWGRLLALAERHDFRVFADECYSEIYRGAPPPGALEVAREQGVDAERVVIFHSLSKRSSAPGLRSGFVAGGPRTIAACRRLRAYAGAPLPLPLQAAAARLWADEGHVAANRENWRRKYRIADEIMAGYPGYVPPEAGFFLWLPVADGEAAALRIWRQSGVRVLPGAYLSRDTRAGNPGKGHVRVALVADDDDIRRGLTAIRDSLENSERDDR